MTPQDPGTGAVRVLTDAAEATAATGDHPVAVLDVGAGFVAPGWAVGNLPDGAVALHRRSDHGVPGSAVLGSREALATLLDDPAVRAWVTGGANRHVSVPRGCIDVATSRLDLGERGGEWDWLWTTRSPPQVRGEDRVVELDPTARDEAEAFLAHHSPTTHGQPFARPGQRWVAVRDPGDGALVAVGGCEPSQAGTPTLAGIAVAGHRRGEGWGAAVTARLTRDAVATTGACALGMFADNDVARRLYLRLGFTTGMEWTSRWFA
ncbi:GNAT family N-acetyltransferase [Oryzobacter telluris]|uniref:GNAT family N-acetyltransferase n=1 Tax=Oryzobacter telluris TaxID=3149179 RepID=UPI00370DBAB5